MGFRDTATLRKNLENMNYQVIRAEQGQFSDEELVDMARSIFDANINDDTGVSPSDIFPTSALGVSISWEEDNQRAVFERASKLMYDDLTDNELPTPFDQDVEPVLGVNGDFLILNDGVFLGLDLSGGMLVEG